MPDYPPAWTDVSELVVEALRPNGVWVVPSNVIAEATGDRAQGLDEPHLWALSDVWDTYRNHFRAAIARSDVAMARFRPGKGQEELLRFLRAGYEMVGSVLDMAIPDEARKRLLDAQWEFSLANYVALGRKGPSVNDVGCALVRVLHENAAYEVLGLRFDIGRAASLRIAALCARAGGAKDSAESLAERFRKADPGEFSPRNTVAGILPMQ